MEKDDVIHVSDKEVYIVFGQGSEYVSVMRDATKDFGLSIEVLTADQVDALLDKVEKEKDVYLRDIMAYKTVRYFQASGYDYTAVVSPVVRDGKSSFDVQLTKQKEREKTPDPEKDPDGDVAGMENER